MDKKIASATVYKKYKTYKTYNPKIITANVTHIYSEIFTEVFKTREEAVEFAQNILDKRKIHELQ